jgi:ketosteroid isomerase-like protein
MYTVQDEAIKKCDFKAFISTLAPDYSIKLLNGDVFSRQQVEGFVESDMARTKSVEKSLSSIDSLSAAKNEAVVIVTHEASRVLDDADGQPHKWENKVVHKETWIKTAEGWRIQRLEELKQVYVLRDGKPLHP